jgi:hypothetical protein
MGKHETGYARVPRDAYTTPSWCIDALAEHVQLEGRKIWECAANSGRMVRALQAQGAKVFASDIDPHPGLDAVFDFLSPCLSPEIPAWDGIITNPPWGARNRLAEAFIRKGFDHLNNNGGFLALLLPTDFDSAVSRLSLFCDQRFTARISLTARPVWFKRPMDYARLPKRMLRGLSGRAPSCDIRDRHWPFMPLLDRTKRPATSSIPMPHRPQPLSTFRRRSTTPRPTSGAVCPKPTKQFADVRPPAAVDGTHSKRGSLRHERSASPSQRRSLRARAG